MADSEQIPSKLREAPVASKRGHRGNSQDSSQTRPAKKAKIAGPDLSPTSSSIPVESRNAPPPIDPLASSYDITSMSIISSSKIEQKVTRTLQSLAEYPAIHPAKPKVVKLHAKAAVASKLITIAEIAKREIAKGGGKWFQYNKVEEVMVEQKRKQEEKNVKGKEAGVKNVEEDIEAEEEGFETMKTPFERSIEDKLKVRGLPVMTLYLSRVRIDSLRKEYGEQSNALEAAK